MVHPSFWLKEIQPCWWDTQIASLQSSKTSNKEYPRDDTHQYIGEAALMMKVWGNAEYVFIATDPSFTLTWSDSTW